MGAWPIRSEGDFVPHVSLTPLLDTGCDILSTGQRQLVAVTLALARPGALTLLDEPLASVDIRQRRHLLDAIGTLGDDRRHVTIVSSHIAADLGSVCDWVVVLRDGGYCFRGSRSELLGASKAGPGDEATLAAFERRILELLG